MQFLDNIKPEVLQTIIKSMIAFLVLAFFYGLAAFVFLRRNFLDWYVKKYAGADGITDDREMNVAIGNGIQVVMMLLIIFMVTVQFVFDGKDFFGDWKWIVFFSMIGAQFSQIAPYAQGIIQAIKNKKIG